MAVAAVAVAEQHGGKHSFLPLLVSENPAQPNAPCDANGPWIAQSVVLGPSQKSVMTVDARQRRGCCPRRARQDTSPLAWKLALRPHDLRGECCLKGATCYG